MAIGVLAAWFCAVVAIAQPAAAIDAGEHVTIGLVLAAPAGDLGRGSSRSEIIGAVDAALREKTSLRVSAYEAEAVTQRCPEGTFRCLVALENERAAPERSARMLASISVAVGEDRTQARLAVVLVDVARAAACTGDDADACIARTAIAVKLNAPAIATEAVAEKLRGFFLHDARAVFTERGWWEPYGSIAVVFPAAGFELELDGRMIGATAEKRTVIERVLPGARTLRATRDGESTDAATALVVSGRTEDVVLAIRDTAVRTALFWAGISSIAAGIAVTTYAAVRAGDADRVVLCDRPCSSRFFSSSGQGVPERLEDDTNAGGLYFAPLGLGLAGAGAVWTAGGLFAGDDRPPWLEFAIGGAVLIATYVLGASIGGGSP